MRSKEPIPVTYIDALLEERGMRANELAEKVGISTSYMSKLRNRLAPVTPQLAVVSKKVVQPFEWRDTVEG